MEITDNVLKLVTEHIIRMPGWVENGYAGYQYNKQNEEGSITLCVIDNSKVKIIPIED